LRHVVLESKTKDWQEIAKHFPQRTDLQCLQRWQRVLNPNFVKGSWSPEEDALVIALVAEHGPRRWSTIAKDLQGRSGKQCRER